MKKIFRIASYDFKRLITNPFTIAVMVVVMIFCFIMGFVYNIPTTPAYTCQLSGQTTQEAYRNFISPFSTSQDSSSALKNMIDEARDIISVQKDDAEINKIREVNSQFQTIYIEVRIFKFKYPNKTDKYTDTNDLSDIKIATQGLSDFVNEYENFGEFETTLYFNKNIFASLKEISAFFSQVMQEKSTATEVMTAFAENTDKFETLDSITKNNLITWKVSPENLTQLGNDYITLAEAKLAKIENEMTIYMTATGTEHFDELQSLATSFKLTCESALAGVKHELKLLLKNHFGNLNELQNYTNEFQENIKLELVQIKNFLQDDGLYYTDRQIAMNFNMASSQVTAYDNTYFIISIVGFLNVLFGIFCAYKLFGLDRRNGKMDVILSQNVTFGQVFVGKVLAITFITSFMMAVYLFFNLLIYLLCFPVLAESIMTVFNLSTVYTIHPILFLLIKVIGIELQVVFYCVLTVFLMNLSRKFELFFAIALAIFAVATVCNIFLNGSLVYCLFPFIHADLTSFLGGATMQTGFLVTSLYSYGNFFISLAYYLVCVLLLFNFTKQLFKKN